MLISSELVPHIYRSSSVLELIDNVQKFELMPHGNDPLKQERFNKLFEYRNTVVDIQYLQTTRMYFNELYEIIAGKFPNLKFFLEGRRKSFINFYEKMLETQLKCKLLRTQRDTTGFRIVSLDPSIEVLYELLQLLIKFFTEFKDFKLCELKVTESGKFNPAKHPEIIVPEKSFVPTRYKKFVKDYVANPKENGYQSLHIVLFDKNNNKFLEIQIRNFQMHAVSEAGKANHEEYKDNKKKNSEKILRTDVDLSKINMNGFIVTNPKEDVFFDEIGLFKSVSLLVRHKTYCTKNITTIM